MWQWHGKEVDADQITEVIVQKRAPRLGRWFRWSKQVFGHGAFGHIMSQQAEFRFNPRCAPCRILFGHPSD